MSDENVGEFHYLGHKMPYLPADGCTGRLIVVGSACHPGPFGPKDFSRGICRC